MFRIKYRHAAIILSAVISIIVSILVFEACVKKQSELISGQFETAFIDKGSIETWEVTDGIVEPANEVLILSPSSSVLQRIEKEPGQKVEEGETILQLDTKALRETIENLNDQLEMKRNNLLKTQLTARSTRVDLSYNADVKKLKISSIKSLIADQEQLLEVGGISPAKLETSKQELVLAQKDLELVTEKNAIRLAQLDADETGLQLQIEMQEKDLKNQLDLLNRMTVKAPSAGIILEIHGQVGEKIAGDKLLVKMSDLTRFKILGTIKDDFKDLIKTGKLAYVMVDGSRLEGRIGTINPAMKDDQIKFYVRLSENNHPKLIPNQKVELHVIRRSKRDVLRIKNGDAFGNAKSQTVFVIQNGIAMRRQVELGFITNEFLEVKAGAEEGELLIISNTSPYLHLEEVEIKNQ